jgi:hypothetical protein
MRAFTANYCVYERYELHILRGLLLVAFVTASFVVMHVLYCVCERGS